MEKRKDGIYPIEGGKTPKAEIVVNGVVYTCQSTNTKNRTKLLGMLSNENDDERFYNFGVKAAELVIVAPDLGEELEFFDDKPLDEMMNLFAYVGEFINFPRGRVNRENK